MRLILTSIVTYGFASVFLKKGALSMHRFTIENVLTNYFYLLSILFLLLHAFFWQMALKRFDLNDAFIYKSIYYPVLLCISYFIFNEEITLGNIIGTCLIVFGVIKISKGKSLNV